MSLQSIKEINLQRTTYKCDSYLRYPCPRVLHKVRGQDKVPLKQWRGTTLMWGLVYEMRSGSCSGRVCGIQNNREQEVGSAPQYCIYKDSLPLTYQYGRWKGVGCQQNFEGLGYPLEIIYSPLFL